MLLGLHVITIDRPHSSKFTPAKLWFHGQGPDRPQVSADILYFGKCICPDRPLRAHTMYLAPLRFLARALITCTSFARMITMPEGPRVIIPAARR
jgi:hypothetical protein